MPRKKGDVPLTLPEIEKAKTLAAMGKSYRRIGAELGRSDHTVKRLLTTPEVVEEVADKKAELAERYQAEARRILDSISDKDIDKASLQNKAVSSGIFLDKALLLRDGLPAININILLTAVEAIKQMRREGPRELLAGEPEG